MGPYMLRVALACAFLSALPIRAQAQALDPALARRIDADVRAALAHAGAPGGTIAIIRDGHLDYAQAYGWRDAERHLPARIDTHYEIGSITKQFTVAAILQLRAAGKLDIDAKLAAYLPNAPHAGEVTLRQLMSHTSGLHDYFDTPDVEAAAVKPARFDQVIARVAALPLDFAPGSRWSYSNTGYVLLGRIIELASGESYNHYVRAHFLRPLGMVQSFTVADEARLPDMAVGYRSAEGRRERAPTISDGFGWSAGNIVSTLADLEKWNRALMAGKVVSAADYRLMTTSVMTTDSGDAGYGLGLFVDRVLGQPRIGHTGGSFGFTTANEYFPNQQVRIIAFTNDGDGPPEPGETLTNVVFDDLYPEIAAAAARPAPGEDPAATAAAAALFAQLQQAGDGPAHFTERLTGKMTAGLAQRLAKQLGGYGAATAVIFKGQRADGDTHWTDYLIQFGPGSTLNFAVAYDAAGAVTSLSFG